MQIIQSSKPAPRAFRQRIVDESLNRPQIQRLESLYENSSSVKNLNWNPNRTDPYVSDVVNGQSILNIQETRSQRRRAKADSIIDDRIVINICGSRYETHRTTLELYPDTLLGNVKRRKYYYDKHRKEYFFDRNRACFEAILYYYQSHGRLRRPDYIPLDIFLEEVTFFQLGQEALDQLRKDENIKQIKKIHLPKNRILRYIWIIMEYPGYSLTAKIVNAISLSMVLLSTIILAIESLPQYTHLDDLNCQQDSNSSSAVISYMNSTANSTPTQNLYICPIYYTSPFFIIQAICIGFFTIEIILRIIATPSIIHFIKNIMNWIDFAAVIPFYVSLGIRLSGQQQDINSNTYTGLRLLRILRIARVFKFFRIFKSVKSLRVLATTVRQSLLDFLIMIVLLTLLGFLFGAATFYAENDSNGVAFDSIPKATYWGIITVTGVGYGDIVPLTPTGRVITCLCALFGAVTVGMLVSVLVDRYQRVYTRKLFIEEEIPDFDDDSDDEDNDSRDLSFGSIHRGSLRIEDPDARAKENAVHHHHNNIIEPPDPQEDSPIEMDQNPLKHHGNRIHFILGYVDDENQETSHDLVEKISSFILDKRLSGDDISLNIIPNKNSPINVQFQLESSDDDDNDEDQDFTEISHGCLTEGNVLKTFQHSSF